MNALEKSIKHWEDNLKIAKKELGKPITETAWAVFKFGNSRFSTNGGDCPLCDKYAINYCMNCPVCKRTRMHDCWKTPYHDLVNILYDECPPKVTEEIVRLVNKEVKFLKSLVPKKKKSSTKKKLVKKER